MRKVTSVLNRVFTASKKTLAKTILALLLPLAFSTNCLAQTYSSGSTGANGIFPPGTLPGGTYFMILNLGTGVLTYYDNYFQVKGSASVNSPNASGVFNFTSFSVPLNTELLFTPDSLNRPVYLLVESNAIISGRINIDGGPGAAGAGISGGVGGAGGPGSYRGGSGGNAGASPTPGAPGVGPGGGRGGNAGDATGATGLISNEKLIPLIGGSGGGGAGPLANQATGPYGGGGGGGALLIGASGTITINGVIQAVGGYGYSTNNVSAGGGSGGAVRLIATTINGSGQINVTGGGGGVGGTTNGGAGAVRIEAYNNTYSGVYPSTSVSSTAFSGAAFPTGLGTIKVQSVGGITTPASGTGGQITTPDVTFPTSQTTPIDLAVTSSGIPIGTAFDVRVAAISAAASNAGAATTYTGTIGGTLAAGSGVVQIVLPVGTSIITVIASFQVAGPQAALLENALGEKVARLEAEAGMGGMTETYIVTASGKRFSAKPFAHLMTNL